LKRKQNKFSFRFLNRFEILGCRPAEIIPEIGFVASPLPAGFISTRWSLPAVIIFDGEKVNIPSSFFRVDVSHIENDETFNDVFNVTDTSIILSSPMWGADYVFSILCSHPSLGPLNCGTWTVEAVVASTPECFAHTSACRLPDRGNQQDRSNELIVSFSF
jgi:hypothetical protein